MSPGGSASRGSIRLGPDVCGPSCYLSAVPLPVDWGDLPTWLQAIGGLGQLGHAIWYLQVRRVSQFGESLEEEAQLDDGELARQVREHPEVAALVLEGIEQSMRSASEEK